ncbi:MAG: hypothetical protein MZV70_30345 [Desulfobacterales bacterium]|nr:hypothetical protein [Desulfobacterales bacterium]
MPRALFSSTTGRSGRLPQPLMRCGNERAGNCSHVCPEPEHQCDQSLRQCLRVLRVFKKPGDEGIYFHDKAEIQKKAALAKTRGVSEICTVSGLHPDFTAQSYVDVYRWIHEAAPGVHLHASNPMEVAYAAKKSRMSTQEVLVAMKEAGLGSMCGTAAEILVDSVRDTICREKIPTQEWVRIINEAHGLGHPTTATIMYGHCESDADRVRHLAILREIQDDTHGFTEFVPLSFIHMNTPILPRRDRQGGSNRKRGSPDGGRCTPLPG